MTPESDIVRVVEVLPDGVRVVVRVDAEAIPVEVVLPVGTMARLRKDLGDALRELSRHK